jgi:hypothetical protein
VVLWESSVSADRNLQKDTSIAQSKRLQPLSVTPMESLSIEPGTWHDGQMMGALSMYTHSANDLSLTVSQMSRPKGLSDQA